jgi:signal transduction histidine kinase
MRFGDRLTGTGVLAADLTLAALFAAALAMQALAIATSWGGGYWVFGMAAGVVVCSAALLRRRNRSGAAVAGLAVAGISLVVAWTTDLPREPSAVMALGLAVLIGSVVRTMPAKQAGLIATAGFALVIGAAAADLPSVSAVAAFNGVTWAGGLACGLWLRLVDTRRLAAAELVRRDERVQLARELHDVVAHHITGIVLQTQAVQLMAEQRPADVRRLLAEIESAASDALTSIRQVVGVLRDTEDGVSFTPGPEGLPELVERFGRGGRKVQLRVDATGSPWPLEVQNTVYRVIQEALTNVARHAGGTESVSVSVVEDEHGLTIEIADDGRVATSRLQRGSGYGLIGMRERVEALNGTFAAGPGEDRGWTVRVMLPAAALEKA